MFLKPITPELKIPDPLRKDYLPPEGREITIDPYWTRRQLANEVVEVIPKEVKKILAKEEE